MVRKILADAVRVQVGGHVDVEVVREHEFVMQMDGPGFLGSIYGRAGHVEQVVTVLVDAFVERLEHGPVEEPFAVVAGDDA